MNFADGVTPTPRMIAPPDDERLELPPDRLDLGQLGHAALEPQASMTTGTIIGRRLVRSLTNGRRPGARRAGASRGRWRRASNTSLIACAHHVGALVEQLLGLGGVDPAAGDDLGAGEDGAVVERRR